MQRILSTAVIAGLLVATAAAFAITERLKLEKSPIFGTKIATHISPTCGCARGKARIELKLRHGDAVTVTIRDRSRGLVDTIATGLQSPKGVNEFRWNGRTGTGKLAPEGAYFVEVHLAKQHRTLLLPNEIALDSTAPEVLDATPRTPAFSPDGDHEADSVTVAYTLSEPAHLNVWFRGRRIIHTLFHPMHGRFRWDGLLGGMRLPVGAYVLTVGATDLAGNATPPSRRAHVRVVLRYITLASRRVVVQAGSKLSLGVSTDARRYGWKLGARHGRAHGPVLRVPVPAKAGTYRLVVTERGHSDHATVVVR